MLGADVVAGRGQGVVEGILGQVQGVVESILDQVQGAVGGILDQVQGAGSMLVRGSGFRTMKEQCHMS